MADLPQTLQDFLDGILPVSEKHLAGLLGIKPRSLRTERDAGRIAFKPIAKKIFYRPADVKAWLDEGVPCRDGDRGPGSYCDERRDESPSTSSAGSREAANESARRALAAARALKTRSQTSSSDKSTGRKADRGRVIPMTSSSPTS